MAIGPRVTPGGLGEGASWVPESVWRPLLLRSIDALEEGALDEGLRACLTLLSAQHLPSGVRELVYWNQVDYAQPLTDLVAGAVAYPLDGTDPGTWSAPSPFVADHRMRVLARAEPPENDGEHHDVLLALDERFRVDDARTIRDETGLAARFDDVRPFLLEDRLHVALRLYDPEVDEWTRAGVAEVGDNAYRNLHTFGPRAGYFRQGWAPLLTETGPHFLAWWEPTEMMRLADEGELFTRDTLRRTSRVAERFVSGSQGVPVPGGHLVLVNETVALAGGEEMTLSRFARLDARFQLTDISPQFFVADRGDDVATGLACRGDQLIAGFDTGSGAKLATMDLGTILGTLIAVVAPGNASR
jgi:hypothetical protein